MDATRVVLIKWISESANEGCHLTAPFKLHEFSPFVLHVRNGVGLYVSSHNEKSWTYFWYFVPNMTCFLAIYLTHIFSHTYEKSTLNSGEVAKSYSSILLLRVMKVCQVSRIYVVWRPLLGLLSCYILITVHCDACEVRVSDLQMSCCDLIKSGLILGLCPANERRRYKVTPSLIGGAQT